MHILLTGANGFVGSHLLKALEEEGHDLTLFLRPSADTEAIAPALNRWRVVRGDYEESDALAAACDGAEAVIHCAGSTRARRVSDYARMNTLGTARLAEAANRQHGMRHVLLLSSLAAAGPGTPDRPAREEDVPRPVSAYGRSKLAGEQAVRERCAVPWTFLRPPWVYGPRDHGFETLVRWIARARGPLWHTGRQPLSMIYVGDLARAVISCLDRPVCHGRVYHVAHPAWTDPESLVREIARALGRERHCLPLPRAALWAACGLSHARGWLTGTPTLTNLWKWPELAAPGWVCDSGRLPFDTGFKAAIDLPEGIARTVQEGRARGWPDKEPA